MANPHSAKMVTDYDWNVTRSKSGKVKSVSIEVWYGVEDTPVKITLPIKAFFELAGGIFKELGQDW